MRAYEYVLAHARVYVVARALMCVVSRACVCARAREREGECARACVVARTRVSPRSYFGRTEKVQPFSFGSRMTRKCGDQEVCWVNPSFFDM